MFLDAGELASRAGSSAGGREARYTERLRGALRGKRILVTGASSGIGRAFALQVGRAGGCAVLVARRPDGLERVADEVKRRGGSCSAYAADLSDPTAARELTRRVLRDEGPVAVIVNNAGLSIRRPIAESPYADFERMMAINYFGSVAIVLGFLPSMLEQGFGHVVQVSTIGVQTGAPNFAAYVAAKAAAEHFVRMLRLELSGRGIHATTVAMPLVRTPMMAPTRIYRAFPALDADTAARRIGWAVIERPPRVAPRWTTSLEILHAQCPGLAQWLFARFHDPFHRLMKRRLARLDRQRNGA